MVYNVHVTTFEIKAQNLKTLKYNSNKKYDELMNLFYINFNPLSTKHFLIKNKSTLNLTHLGSFHYNLLYKLCIQMCMFFKIFKF
jgi:hypothetical protein